VLGDEEVLQLSRWAVTTWLIFIGMFLRGAAAASYQSVVLEQALAQARVRDLMIPDPVIVPPDLTVDEMVEQSFLRYGFGGFPVGHDGEIEGLVSLRQVKACPPAERRRRTVREIMRPADASVRVAATASAADALRRMAEADSGRLLVTDGGRVIGLITRTGITNVVQIKAELEGETALG
jgi:predicted transcriptional regulator